MRQKTEWAEETRNKTIKTNTIKTNTMNNFDLRKFIKENREEIVSPFNGAGWNERFFEEMGLLNLIENFKLLGEELKSAKRGDEIGGDTLYDIVGLLEQLSTNLSTITNDIDTVDADQE